MRFRGSGAVYNFLIGGGYPLVYFYDEGSGSDVGDTLQNQTINVDGSVGVPDLWLVNTQLQNSTLNINGTVQASFYLSGGLLRAWDIDRHRSRGECPVESVVVGSLVVTTSGKAEAVVWVGAPPLRRAAVAGAVAVEADPVRGGVRSAGVCRGGGCGSLRTMRCTWRGC